MSTRRVRVTLQVQRITCPGVYLCSSSQDIELTVSALGSHRTSRRQLRPAFPLCIHETFVVERAYDKMPKVDSNHCDCQIAHIRPRPPEPSIWSEPVRFTLWHCSRRLAYLDTELRRLHHSKSQLMRTTQYFPGSIAPLLLCSVHVELLELCEGCRSNDVSRAIEDTHIQTKKYSQQSLGRCNECNADIVETAFKPRGGMRQNSVCHGRMALMGERKSKHPADFDSLNSVISSEVEHCNRAEVCKKCPHIPDCIQPNGKSVSSLRLQSLHQSKACIICNKYREYFS